MQDERVQGGCQELDDSYKEVTSYKYSIES